MPSKGGGGLAETLLRTMYPSLERPLKYSINILNTKIEKISLSLRQDKLLAKKLLTHGLIVNDLAFLLKISDTLTRPIFSTWSKQMSRELFNG